MKPSNNSLEPTAVGAFTFMITDNNITEFRHAAFHGCGSALSLGLRRLNSYASLDYRRQWNG
jgi:hypothetical protein